MKIRRPIFIMAALFGAAVAGGAFFSKGIAETLHHNPIAISAIIALTLVGLGYTLYAIIGLWRAQKQWSMLEKDSVAWTDELPLAGALKFFSGRLVHELGSADMKRREEIIEAFETSLALRARLAEYLAGLLIGLGLLGTFIGLMATMGSIGDVLASLNSEGGGAQAMLESLSAPLSGMSSAFSASLMGLLGSLLMGAVAQFMSDANDNLVQRIRTWSQRGEVEATSFSNAVVETGGVKVPSVSLVEKIWLPRIYSVLQDLQDGEQRRNDALRTGLETLALVAKEQVEQQRGLRADVSQVRDLLGDSRTQLASLVGVAHSLAACADATRHSLDGIFIGMTNVVASQNENRVAVKGAVQSLTDTLAGLAANGSSSNRKLDAIEQAIVGEAATLRHMTQSVIAQHEAVLELVRHVSSIAAQGAMLGARDRAERLVGEVA